MIDQAHEEAIRVLESVGHFEEAEHIREEIATQTSEEDSVINRSRSVLIYVLAKTLEQEFCAKSTFPCNLCVLTARKLLNVVVALMEKMSIHTFINMAKETDIRKAVLLAFHYAIASTKKKLINNQPVGTIWKLPPTTKKSPEESLKIVKISEKQNDTK